jgi:hypothetical protein
MSVWESHGLVGESDNTPTFRVMEIPFSGGCYFSFITRTLTPLSEILYLIIIFKMITLDKLKATSEVVETTVKSVEME